MDYRFIGDDCPALGKGALLALFLLLLVELSLHFDVVAVKYRSVFAAARLIDKIEYVAKQQPQFIVVGNSRVDNGFSPEVFAMETGLAASQVFNLGIPGANARVLNGLSQQLPSLMPNLPVPHLFIALDPMLFVPNEELGYSTFVADRAAMWQLQDYEYWLKSIFRLWGFADNLKGLRNGYRLQSLLKASVSNVPAWGGELELNQGFRAKAGILSPLTLPPPSFRPTQLEFKAKQYFYRAVETLQKKGYQVAVFFPLVYEQGKAISVETKFTPSELAELTDYMNEHHIAILPDVPTTAFSSHDFFNFGHLNLQGANKFTTYFSTRVIDLINNNKMVGNDSNTGHRFTHALMVTKGSKR